MKKQYLFSVLAFSAFLASCSNEIETVAESVKPEAEMEEVVGATLVSKGMSIDVNGPESRQTKEGWEETDLLGMGWYNVASSISLDQTKGLWESVVGNTSWTEHRIFANHKFINFTTESNVYQGAHFVYFPYQRETKIQQKVVEANALDYTVSAAESMTDAEYDLYNRAFQLSAQDFVSGGDVDDNGELKKQFRLSPMVNGMTVNAIPTLEETATAIKGLKITSVEILSQQNETFAEEFAIKPNLIPAVVRTEEDEIDGTATDAALDAYIKGAEKTYVNKVTRDVAAEANYDLSVQRDINVYTFPTKAGYDKTAANKPIIYVNVVSPNGLVGQFAAAQYGIHTAKNKETVQKLHEFLGYSAATLQNVLRLDGVWTTLSLPTELDESNLVMTYNINNKPQWDDAVALAKEIGADAKFTLVGEVAFTESINLPEGIELTVVSGTNGKMVIDGDIEWPNTDDLDVTEADIVVEEDATLSINGEEGNRNTLVGKLVNKGTIALNEYGTVGSKTSNITNTYTDGTVQKNGRVEVKYGAYAYAEDGIVAFEVSTDTPAYQIENLIVDATTVVGDHGQALVNTLVINAGNELDLNKKNEQQTTYDPYAGTTVTIPAAVMPDLSAVNIEMNGGKMIANANSGKSVKNVEVLGGESNEIWNVNIENDLNVEAGQVTLDATQIGTYKESLKVKNAINNEAKIVANVDIYTKTISNPAGATTTVNSGYTIWYAEENGYEQGGTASGNILPLEGGEGLFADATTVKYNSKKTAQENGELLQAAIEKAKDGATLVLAAGTYEVEHIGGNGDIENKSLTIIGSNGTIIKGIGNRPFGFRVTSDTEKVVNIKNITIQTEGTYSSIYVKGNAIVNLYNVCMEDNIHIDVVSQKPTNVDGDGFAPNGTKATVNAYNVTSADGKDIQGDLLAMPSSHNSVTKAKKTYAYFNFEGGNVVGAFANSLAISTGDNMFVNGVALPANE